MTGICRAIPSTGHALDHGRPNLLIELRNDLIATPEGQAEWARRLAPVIERVLADSGL